MGTDQDSIGMKNMDITETIVQINKAHTEKIEQLQAELKQRTGERNILAMLCSDKPEFFNPLRAIKAKVLRDKILSGLSKPEAAGKKW